MGGCVEVVVWCVEVVTRVVVGKVVMVRIAIQHIF